MYKVISNLTAVLLFVSMVCGIQIPGLVIGYLLGGAKPGWLLIFTTVLVSIGLVNCVWIAIFYVFYKNYDNSRRNFEESELDHKKSIRKLDKISVSFLDKLVGITLKDSPLDNYVIQINKSGQFEISIGDESLMVSVDMDLVEKTDFFHAIQAAVENWTQQKLQADHE